MAYGVTTKGNGDAFISEERHTSLSGGGGQAGQGYPCVAYSFDSLASNSMKSKNPHSGCREVEVAKTLDTTDPNPSKNQGGIAIVEEKPVAYGLDRASFNQGQNAKFDFTITEEQQPTLTARGPGAVCTIGLNGGQVSPTLISRMSSAVGTTQDNLIVTEKHEEAGPPTMCCTSDSFTQVTEEVSPTLMARDWKDPTVVLTNYIVRRLTPTECARLQGFADQWGHIDPKTDFTDEEYRFWMEVRNTHARINGKKEQEYTVKQMLTWYNKLWTDSAEYKMWGNGIALPTALYVVQGIADALDAAEMIADELNGAEELIEDWML